MKNHSGFKAILVFAILFVQIACSSTQIANKKEPGLIIVIDPSTLSNLNSASAWLSYGGMKLVWYNQYYHERNPNSSEYQYTFDEELEARNFLIEIWLDTKEEDPTVNDAYLDSMVTVKQAGFLSEYVWYYFKAPNWKIPENLKMEEFKKWIAVHLPGHKPETKAVLDFR